METEFIRALEHHRATVLACRQPEPEAISVRLLVSWIYHDNMLEGGFFNPAEIQQALQDDDDAVDRYLHPLMKRIRRYRDAIRFIHAEASHGPMAVNLDNLKVIHRMLTPAAADRGGLYRQTSPVHRDYYQRICSAEKVPYHLRRLFEQIESEADTAYDPVTFAAEIHIRLMHVYPFRRNPGTTARLFTNLLLLSRGYPPAIIPAQLRSEYYEALCRPDSRSISRIYRDAVQGYLEQTDPPDSRQRHVGLS